MEGTTNVVEACIDAGVKRAVLISTDKAVEPTTTYGATKLMAERIFIHGNSYSGGKPPDFFCVRYGNVMASQGSVLRIWRDQAERGEPLSVVDPEMTRFWWRVSDAAEFVFKCLNIGRAGDIYVPILPSCNLEGLAHLVVPDCEMVQIMGNPMEKQHEDMLASHELSRATVMPDGTVRVSMLQEPPADEPALHMRLNSADFVDLERVANVL